MTSLSTYDFSTLYTTLPYNLIKDKLIDFIERTFQREGTPYLAIYNRNAYFTKEKPKKYHAWSCQNVFDALTFSLDNIFIPAFFFRKKGYINFVSKSVRRPSVRLSVRLSVCPSVRAYVRPSRFL